MKQCVPVLLIAILLSACQPVPQITPAATPITPEIETSPTVTEPPTAEPATPTARPAEPVARFGEPVTLGRGGIRDAAFSPDRETIAIGWTNGVSLTGVKDRQDRWYHPTPQVVTALDVSAEYVTAVLVNGDVWLFHAMTGDSQVFAGAAHALSYSGDVAWSPDGARAAIQTIGGAGARASPILLLDPAAGEIRELPNSHTDPGWRPRLHWSPDGTLIAAADPNGRAWVLDADTGEVVFRAEVDQPDYRPIIHGWLPGSATVVYDARDGLRLVDVTTGALVQELKEVTANVFLSNPLVLTSQPGLALVNGPTDHPYEIPTYEVWDLAAGKQVETPLLGERRHVNGAGCMWLERPAVAFDGETLLYLDTDGQLVRWQVGEAQGELLGQVEVRYPCLGTPMVWSPDSTRLVLETDPGKAVTVWDAATGQMLAERRDGTYPANIHGPLLAYRGAEEQLIVWDLEGKTARFTLPGPVTPLLGGIAFSPDGSLLAYGVGSALHITEAATGEVLAKLDANPAEQLISHIHWAPGSDALAASGGLRSGDTSQSGTTILWEREDSSFQEVFRTETVHANYDVDWVNIALFSPLGRYVAMERMPEFKAASRAVLVYDRERGEIVLERQEYVIQQWLSDEVLLVTEAGGDGTFFEWNVQIGEEHAIREGGLQYELGSYAPDGIHHAYIASYSRKVVIRKWQTGGTVAEARHGLDVQDMRYSPDGSRLAVRGSHGLVTIWPVIYTKE